MTKRHLKVAMNSFKRVYEDLKAFTSIAFWGTGVFVFNTALFQYLHPEFNPPWIAHFVGIFMLVLAYVCHFIVEFKVALKKKGKNND